MEPNFYAPPFFFTDMVARLEEPRQSRYDELHFESNPVICVHNIIAT